MTLRLIAAIEEETCLWDVESSNYKIRDVRELAWETVASIVQVTAAEANNKWRLLRQQFRVSIHLVLIFIRFSFHSNEMYIRRMHWRKWWKAKAELHPCGRGRRTSIFPRCYSCSRCWRCSRNTVNRTWQVFCSIHFAVELKRKLSSAQMARTTFAARWGFPKRDALSSLTRRNNNNNHAFSLLPIVQQADRGANYRGILECELRSESCQREINPTLIDELEASSSSIGDSNARLEENEKSEATMAGTNSVSEMLCPASNLHMMIIMMHAFFTIVLTRSTARKITEID